MDTECHGGGCCGVNHIFNFPYNPEATDDQRISQIKAAIAEIIDNYDIDYDCDCEYDRACNCYEAAVANWSCACECVLTTLQLTQWRQPLETVGFREVHSFYNSNSGNTCHVFYFTTKGPLK